jgi:hypothetical protein
VRIATLVKVSMRSVLTEHSRSYLGGVAVGAWGLSRRDLRL